MTTQVAAISIVRTTTNRRNTTKEGRPRQRRSPLFGEDRRLVDPTRTTSRRSAASPKSDAVRAAFFAVMSKQSCERDFLWHSRTRRQRQTRRKAGTQSFRSTDPLGGS